ncbi:MAG: PolC-type DNA polymerase III [Spirochaetales bacterium]
MENLLKYLNQKTYSKYAFLKMGGINYYKDKNTLNLVFLYPNEIGAITDEQKEEILSVMKDYMLNEIKDESLNVEIKYIKSFYDEPYIKMITKEFLENNYPSMLAVVKYGELKLAEEENFVKLTLPYLKDYVFENQITKFKESLERHLNDKFLYNFVIELKEVKEALNSNILEKKQLEILEELEGEEEVEKSVVKVEVIEQLIGQETSIKPYCVSAIRSPETQVSVAGTIKYLNEREFNKKQKQGGTEEEQIVEVKKTFYSFYLESAGKELNAVYFPNSSTIEKAQLLADGMQVVLTGDVEEYNSKLSLKVKHITRVKILEKPKEVTKFKNVPANYRYVFPEPFETIGQASLFEEEKEQNDYIKNNTFVVFDLETTGLNYEDCKIVEIGAVKIENGKITEKFSTFVDPEEEIPLDATQIHGITNDMVIGAPKTGEAIADFYKFCYGSVLVAYNIDFDYKFINYYGRQNGYNFDNEQRDALIMARQYIHGLRNYKLKSVCEFLNINLSNAHRAYFDAAATAQVFLKLAENIK